MATRSSITASRGTGTEYAFLSLRGQVQRPGQTLVELSRPGVDGQAYRREGRRSSIFEMIGTVDVDSAAAAATLLSNLQTLREDLVTVKDDLAQTFTAVAVLEVSQIEQGKIAACVGGLSTLKAVIASFLFRMQCTA
jgi:hypothetical protein